MAEERDPVDIVTNKLPMVDPALRRLWAAEILTELHDNGWRIVKTTQPYAYKHVIWDEWKPPAADAAGVAAGPQATPGQVPVCDGFVWIGQPMTSCDRCGQPAWEHQGLDQPPADPFSDAPSTVRPWEPGEAEAIRAKWGRVVAVPTDPTAVRVTEVRRPVPGARDMTGNAVPTDHEDPA